ncbi:MAG TPA: PEP-CTERM sorting domain-containing protein [Burkholderiales bacterium]|nr:PEP-CTERM sorting domain-containing protein [Burkholderiales bacterium]
MKKSSAVASAIAVLMGFAGTSPVGAHIEYYDLNQGRQISDLTAAGKAVAGNDIPLSNPAFWNSTYQTPTSSMETWASLGGSYASGTWGYSVTVVNMDSSSWTDGLRTDPQGGNFLLGDTHKLGFANFHLSQNSLVSITLTDGLDPQQGFGLNPSFSLYRGSAVYQAHDDAFADPLNPKAGIPPVSVQSPQDSGSMVDSQGITSPYRNTLTTGTYYGQFNAVGGFSVGNPAGNWSAVQYITSATGVVNPDGTWAGNSNSNSLLNYLLPAGDYIIAFGGNAQLSSYATARSADTTSPFGAITNLEATLSFNAVAVPVPEPGTWLLMLSGMALVAGVARRRLRRVA